MRRLPRGLPRGTLAIAGVVAGFFLISALTSDRVEFGRFARPVYARWDPGFSPLGVLAIVVGAVIALSAWRALRADPPHPRSLLVVAVLGMLAFAAAVTAIDGTRDAFVAPLERDIDYAGDTRLVDEHGVRGFIEDYPQILPLVRSPHTRTHPPGPVVAAALLEDLSDDPVPRAILLAIASVLVLLPAWWLTRMIAGGRAAALAVLLLAVAPSMVLHTFVSFDAAIATGVVLAIALLVRGLGPDGDPRWAVVGGFVTGVMSLFTFAVGFLAAFGVLYAFLMRPKREAVRLLAWAAAGGVLALVVLRVALGFDLLAVFGASNDVLTTLPSRPRSFWYWLLGNPVVWVAFAGLVTGALAVRELVTKRPPFLVAMVVPLAVFYVLPYRVTGIIPGETERTLLWVYPLAAAAAGAAWVRWETATRPRAGGATLIVGFTAVQSIVMEALYATYW